ncbi:SKI/DACH domain-containing protein 1 [Neosynchiropus ocellatus]
MGDLECGFEEMQGVRLGYLLIQGKQMFALSQVFTELLKNIPRTTVHKRMDHLNVKKHHCDLEELRKLKAINSIAFHAAKCTLISREDVEALYFSCKTERVLKSSKRKAKPACDEEDDEDESAGFLHAEAELWKEKVWFSFHHGAPDTLTLHSRKKVTTGLSGSKLPQIYHKTHARDYRSMAKFGQRHFKNYETAKSPRDYLTLGHTQAFVRGAASRQPLLFQSAMTAQSRLARSDLIHKRKRRREGGGGRHALHHHHHHVPPVLLVQPKTPGAHPPGFGAFHFTPELFTDSRPQHHHHHHHPSLAESCSSDSESSTYSDRAYPDSDFGSGLSTSSASGSSDEECEEDESDSTDVSSDEEDSSSHSDSSSVSSRVSVQSIRFRRARVGSLTKTQHTSKAPLVLQPTFHYTHQEPPRPPSPIRSEVGFLGGSVTDGFNSNYGAETIFAAEEPNRTSSSDRVLIQPTKCPPRPQCDPDTDAKLPRGFDKREPISLYLPLKKIKTEAEDPTVNAPPYSDSGRAVNAPPFNQHNVKVKVEESGDEYEYHSSITAVKCKADKTENPSGVTKQGEGEATEGSPGAPPASPGASHDWKNVQDSEKGNKNCKASALGRKSRVPKTKHIVKRVSKTAPPSQCEEGSTEELPSKRKRNSSSVAANGKMPFSLMAIFPSPPSLVVGSDGDLCPAYSLNSLRAPGTPPPSHPVWSWQPGGHILPPPFAHRTRKY